MANAMFLAWTSPVSQEADEEFRRWYAETHIPEVRQAVPSVRDVRRFRLLAPEESGPARYLVVYELADGDAGSAAAALQAAMASGALNMSTTMDLSTAPPVLQFLESID
jgi:hypothetical protein